MSFRRSVANSSHATANANKAFRSGGFLDMGPLVRWTVSPASAGSGPRRGQRNSLAPGAGPGVYERYTLYGAFRKTFP